MPEVIPLLFTFLLYSAVAFVFWKFYETISKIGKDVAEIKTILRKKRLDALGGTAAEIPPDAL